MGKNVCPGCKEIVLGFGDESELRCLKCETLFKVSDSTFGTEQEGDSSSKAE